MGRIPELSTLTGWCASSIVSVRRRHHYYPADRTRRYDQGASHHGPGEGDHGLKGGPCTRLGADEVELINEPPGGNDRRVPPRVTFGGVDRDAFG